MNRRGLAETLRLLPLGVGMALVDAPWPRMPEVGSALIIAILFTRPRPHRLAAPLLVALLAIWCGLSVQWSLLPGSSVKATVRTMLVLGAAALLVRTLPGRTVAAVVSLGTSILCAMSLLWLALFPSISIDEDGLRGMMPQNNALAYVTAVAVVSTLFAGVYPLWLKAALLVLDLATLVLTDSMTSLLAAVAAAVCAGALMAMRTLTPRLRGVVGALAVGVVAAATYLATQVPLTTLVGRDATLTGRTDIWPDLLPIAEQRWLTGWGHGASWLRGSWIRDWSIFHFNFGMISAHNSLLETFLQLGLVGVALAVILWARTLVRVLVGAWRAPDNSWLVALTILSLIHGQAEATQGAPLGWMVAGILWMSWPETVKDLPRRGVTAPKVQVSSGPVTESADLSAGDRRRDGGPLGRHLPSGPQPALEG